MAVQLKNLFSVAPEPDPETDVTPEAPLSQEEAGVQARGLIDTTESMQQAKELLPTSDRSLVDPVLPEYPGEKRGLLDKYPVKVPLRDPIHLNLAQESTIVPSAVEDAHNEPGVQDYDIVNFLFGGEMAVTGFRYDADGFTWDWDIAKQQWSEQPVWLNAMNVVSLVGTMAFPAAKAVQGTFKFGKAATLLNRAVGFTAEQEMERFVGIGLAQAGSKADNKTLELLRRIENYRSGTENLMRVARKEVAGQELSAFDRVKLSYAKNWSNSYNKIVDSLYDGSDARDIFYKNVNDLFRQEDLGELFRTMPDGEDSGNRIYQHLLTKMEPSLTGKKIALSPQETAWSDMFEARLRQDQAEALELGMIDQPTFDKVGEMHIPAFNKGTPLETFDTKRTMVVPMPGKKKGELLMRSLPIPRLDSPSLLERSKDLPEVYQALVSGDLMTGTADLTTRSVVMHALLKNNYKAVRDIALSPEYAISAEDMALKFAKRGLGAGLDEQKALKAGYVSLETLGTPIKDTLKRMIEKTQPGYLGKSGELPYMHRAVFEELFGQSGIFAQTQHIMGSMEYLTALHKTMKTGFSIPTHFQNTSSNLAFLAQAGFNFLEPENLKIAKAMGGAFKKLSDAAEASRAIGGSTDIAKLGVDLGTLKVGGKTLNLNEVLLNRKARELIEDSAFQNTEAFARLEDQTRRLSDDGIFLKSLTKGLVGTKKILQGQMGGKEGIKWVDQLTKAYLAEDMIPKMTYYTSLLGQGLTEDAAVLEVGRRLPMYNTVGKLIKRARSTPVLPWASFLAESARITKNNLMDHPLRMLPWLHLPGILQSVMGVAGIGPDSQKGVEEAKRQLPLWAQTPLTVVGQSGPTTEMGGAATGALTGFSGGAMAGGPAGAFAGAAIGAGLGYAATKMFPDTERSDKLRGVVMDWLPHSAFMISSNSPQMGGTGTSADVLPFQTMSGLMQQLPTQPFSIIRPLIEMASGQTAYGQDVSAVSAGDQFGKTLAGLLGFVAPPFMQKYGLRTSTPDISLTEALFGEPVWGDISNVSGLLMDTGYAKDPDKSEPVRSMANEFFLKNFSLWKSWATDPANEMSNIGMAEQNMEKNRTYMSKNLSYYLINGMDKEAQQILLQVMGSFTRQHIDDPRKAQDEFGTWLKRMSKSIGKHPRLRGWSQKEIEERLDAASQFSSQERGQARDQMIDFLRGQVAVNRLRNLQMRKEKQKTSKDPYEKWQGDISKWAKSNSIF